MLCFCLFRTLHTTYFGPYTRLTVRHQSSASQTITSGLPFLLPSSISEYPRWNRAVCQCQLSLQQWPRRIPASNDVVFQGQLRILAISFDGKHFFSSVLAVSHHQPQPPRRSISLRGKKNSLHHCRGFN